MRSINATVLIVTLMAILTVSAAGTNVLPGPAVMADMAVSAGLPR